MITGRGRSSHKRQIIMPRPQGTFVQSGSGDLQQAPPDGAPLTLLDDHHRYPNTHRFRPDDGHDQR